MAVDSPALVDAKPVESIGANPATVPDSQSDEKTRTPSTSLPLPITPGVFFTTTQQALLSEIEAMNTSSWFVRYLPARLTEHSSDILGILGLAILFGWMLYTQVIDVKCGVIILHYFRPDDPALSVSPRAEILLGLVSGILAIPIIMAADDSARRRQRKRRLADAPADGKPRAVLRPFLEDVAYDMAYAMLQALATGVAASTVLLLFKSADAMDPAHATTALVVGTVATYPFRLWGMYWRAVHGRG